MVSSKGISVESVVSFLENLAANPSSIPASLREDDKLRKRLLSAIPKLVPELEIPVEVGQRLFYSPLELIAARVAVDLDLFNIFKASPTPLSTEEVAKRTGKSPNPHLLTRILRFLASVGMVREAGTGVWSSSHYGNNLSGEGEYAGIKSTMDNCVLAGFAIPEYLRRHAFNPPEAHEDTPFGIGNREGSEEPTFYEWLAKRPQNARDFNVYMEYHRTGVRTWLDRPEIISEIKDALEKITEGKKGEEKSVAFVDIGGGIGHQCKALRTKVPEFKGKIVLEDLKEVVATAEPGEGIEKVEVNFLQGQPVKGAASYYFRSVLRNWPDPSSRTILGYIRDAMDGDSLLLIDDLVLPDQGAHRYETQLDLTMLAVLNAEARTEAHWKKLLSEVGLEVKDIVFYEEDAREGVIIAKKMVN
ncbi:S-adenosyl-L-methionine-dependent methyltransferase [Hypoxylon fragiforme]|uniref:S-adenosyl-L-methionine-dependent methyltransferase n=1 Tax=Hypoxylon fragiforme TaxID=63214 RepID=UPI0020C6BF0E|nr:S-adenosyl-L-methionine-dependent methyltransferase [Hypoxylon fragiforme]KAI2606353.1 S-adenosyl-L-methionine-dependent methyltransferase [Hypoxylon fragiforme]